MSENVHLAYKTGLNKKNQNYHEDKNCSADDLIRILFVLLVAKANCIGK
jgi:hypothetical protein